ncbi:MAG: hypothetical protein WBY88_12190 [Desulfosarcina sp.]
MQKPIITYESLIRITRSISMIRDPEEVVLITVEGVTHALKVKGCALFLFDKKSGTGIVSDQQRLQGEHRHSKDHAGSQDAQV